MGVHVIDEANRCLQCKKPLCRTGCPVNTPIPQMIKMLLDSQITPAGQMLFDNNPLSLVCSMVCNHDKQCEGHCILQRNNNPIHISSIENYISNSYLDSAEVACAPENGMMAAIIGAGPAGITVAIELRKKGYEVTLFEANDRIGGIMRYGIPEFRLPKTVLDRIARKLRQIGVHLRPNVTIGPSITIDDMFRDGYKSIFIGTGVWRPKKLGIPGESLGNVHFAIDYLKNPESYRLGEKVVVIGMGNSAIDVARTALRNRTRNVTIVTHSKKGQARETELDYAKIDGAELVYGMSIGEINKTGPLFYKNIFDENDRVIGKEKTPIQMNADSVIVAISQGPMNRLVSTTGGLYANDKGLLITNEFGESTRKGIFASGDVVYGSRTIVEAVDASKLVAHQMDRYMRGLPFEVIAEKAHDREPLSP